MIFIVWLFLILIGIICRKSKIVSGMMIIFLIIAAGLCTQGVDYQIYVNEYKWAPVQLITDIHYPGYYYLELLANKWNLSYEQFRVIVNVLAIILYYLGIRKLTNNVNLVYALFLIYPFAHEATQTRSFLADSIIVFAIPFLLREKENRKEKIKDYSIFFLLSILAMSMHFMVSIYVAFAVLFIVLQKKNNIIKIFLGIGITYFLIVLNILPKMVEPLNSRIAYWLSSKTGLGVVFPIAITLAIWGLSKYIIQIMQLHRVERVGNINLSAIEKFSDFMLFLIPLFAYDITFNRLWRLFLILMYACLVRVLFLKDISKNMRCSIAIITSVLLISIFIYENEWIILKQLLDNNSVIGF